MTHHSHAFRPFDPSRINAVDPVELRYWCSELGCTERQLNNAISTVGDHVAAVRSNEMLHLFRRLRWNETDMRDQRFHIRGHVLPDRTVADVAQIADGIVDHPTKEVVRLRNARLTGCGYCRNVRFAVARERGSPRPTSP